MENICKYCYNNPKSHSFSLISDYVLNYTNGNNVNKGKLFYTKIANAELYDDTISIISHYENYLNFIKPDNWIWIIDFEDIELKHTLQINTTIKLAQLIKKYKVNNVIVINENIFLYGLLKIAKPFIKDIPLKIYSKNDKNKFIQFLKDINVDLNIISFFK
jgi:hypothetical protein